VNGAPDFTVYPGDVWSFETEPVGLPVINVTATASSTATNQGPPSAVVDGSGLTDGLHSATLAHMWSSAFGAEQPSWIQFELDRVYPLHEMLVWNSNTELESSIGYGFKDVTIEYSLDGVEYATLGTTHEFARAPGVADYAHNTTIEFGGAQAKYVKLTANSNWGGFLPQFGLSEVRLFHIPMRARKPQPDPGATDVSVDVTLTWRSGRQAAEHKVYVSADEQAVIDGTAPVTTVTEASLSPSSLELGTTYYWRVDEVNNAETPTIWQGDILSFSTQEFIAVEDFESYNDIDPPDPESNRIFESWLDGFADTTNGALVGHDPPEPSYLERTTVHGGGQSLPLFYSNTGGAAYSEAGHTFAAPQDWSKHGVQTLVLWFHGSPGNTGQLYVKINGVKVSYPGAAANLALPGWQVWNIDLASVGTNLQSVAGLAVGVDGSGAAGTLFLDEIGLHKVDAAPINEWRVAAESDDAEEEIPGGGMDRGSSDLELGYEDGTTLQTVGCRWVGIPIPSGVTITEAWVQFSADDVDNSRHVPDVSVVIEGELSASPAAFSDTAGDISSRPRTSASVVWDIPRWTDTHAMGPDERTPDISSIIQQIVDQPGWSGTVVLMFRDNPANPSQGTREAESVDGSATEAPLLHISYQ
jgi:hypothetical protein